MFDILVWWLLITSIGIAAAPLAFHFFRALPGRGYAFAKVLGWLAVGYVYWLLAILGFVTNTFSAMAFIILLFACASWWFGRRADSSGATPLAWLRTEWRFALLVEFVFLASFLAFAYYRAHNPEIDGTEKPMEFMFLNSILKSETFPPHDAWLSGFAISYYYFGYVLVAILTKLSGIQPSIAFNLGLTTLFALSATGAFGLGYALVKASENESHGAAVRSRSGSDAAAYGIGFLSIFLLLIVGNLEGSIESLHSAGYLSPQFVQWLDINNLDTAPINKTFVPSDNWWWWRASRVLNDHDPRNNDHVEVIDEFPSFSFLLGDLHPHVLALPFGLLGLASAFEILIGRGVFPFPFNRQNVWRILLLGVIVGAFGFLNLWDLPTFGFVVVASYALVEWRQRGMSRETLINVAKFAVVLGGLSVLLYSPFYIGFQSQARGVMPVVPFKTPIQQYLIMFGLFDFILASFIGKLILKNGDGFARVWGDALRFAILLVLVPVLIAVGVILVLVLSPDLQAQVASALPINPAGNIPQQTVVIFFSRLLAQPWVTLLQIILISSVGVLILPRSFATREGDRRDAGIRFALLLALTAFTLTFGTEYIYIRDTFGTRMNTVFKLYYQAWALFAMAAAFGVYYLWRNLSRLPRVVFAAGFGLLFAVSMVYPVLAAPNRTDNFKGDATLDGMAQVQKYAPDEYAAIKWLNENAPDDSIILEAPGPQYSDWNRFSMGTGFPTVLGWAGHELQWRGNSVEIDQRNPDVEQIYKSLDANRAKDLLAKFNIRYVIITPREQQKYALATVMIDKFKRIGKVVFEQGNVKIFQVE